MNDSADLFAVYERLALEHRMKHELVPRLGIVIHRTFEQEDDRLWRYAEMLCGLPN